MELQHGDGFLENLENHLNSLGGSTTTAIGGLLQKVYGSAEGLKPDTSFSETFVPLDATLKSGAKTSFAPSSLYDIKAELLKNKAANPAIQTLSNEAPNLLSTAESTAAEAEVAKNIKINSLMNALKGMGGLSMGAIMPPNLSELVDAARKAQFDKMNGA